MAMITSTSAPSQGSRQLKEKKKSGFAQSQKLAKQKSLEKQAKRKKIKLDQLCVFTQQLSTMLEAGLPLVSALEALYDQVEDPVFKIVVRDVKNDIAGGTSFSEATRKFPNAFPNLFVSMAEAGEAAGGLPQLLGKVAQYFEETVRLRKKVKGAMTYPVAVIGLAIALVQVLLIFVIPVFKEMFENFGKELPKPTQLVIDISDFLKGTPMFLPNVLWIVIGLVLFWKLLGKLTSTPKGRVIKDQIIFRMPVIGNLSQKIALSRFCRTYAILLRSGVPILRTLEIVSKASGNTYIEDASRRISRSISQGGQLSETVEELPYFPPTVKHMAKAGEQTGNVDGMMNKIADFYDDEIETIVESLTSLMEPALIVFLGVIIGGLVMAMFLPIFNMAGAVG